MFIDTHIDTLWAMRREKRQFHERSENGHVDLPRAQEADLLLGFFTGYPTDSHYVTENMLKEWVKMVNDPRNKMRKITSYKQLEQLEDKRKSVDVTEREIGVVMTLEGAAGIDSGLNRLYIYHEAGLRAMGLTWNEENQFATGQAQGEHRGLSKEGIDLVAAMEDLGILVDVSHLNDKSFWDVVNNSNGPIFASHSNVRELCDHKRNLTRDQVQAIYDSKGSIGVNLYKAFLEKDGNADQTHAIKMFGEIMKIADVNTVHMGADLDGATLPEDMKDISSLPPLFDRVKNEYSLSDNDMVKIRKENMKRLMKQVWK